MASFGAARFAVRALTAVFLLSGAAFAQQKQASPFIVANVHSEAEAADSVEAKRLATLSAETRAFRALVSRIADFRARPKIPDLPEAEIERLISNIEIRGEGVSSTGYVANFGFHFSERAVAALLSHYGVVPILDRGPEILIVPVFIEEGMAQTGDRNPWRNALVSLDLSHALVPAKVAPARSDLTAAIANAYIANPSASVETLKSQYRTQYILFAVAIAGGSGEVTLRLIGTDSLGQFSVQRKVKGQDLGDEPLLDGAARLAFETVQERWKLTRDTFVQADSGGAGGGAGAGGNGGGTGAPSGDTGGYMSGALSSLSVTAQYSGLKEWQSIRARLQNIPGIQNWDLKSVNPRSAQISFDFPGGASRLSAMAAGQGLTVEQASEGLIVRTR